MRTNVHQLRPAQSIALLACTKCGAETNARCNCGVEYKPKLTRAIEALKANPGKSDRAIAAELGDVSDKTVAKARQSTAELSAVKRVGLDGKARKLPKLVEQEEPTLTAADEKGLTALHQWSKIYRRKMSECGMSAAHVMLESDGREYGRKLLFARCEP